MYERNRTQICRWPNCLLLVLWSLLISTTSVFALGGQPRPPLYTGPGVAGSNIPPTRKPIYIDTAVTTNYVTVTKSNSGFYNPGHQNELVMGQLHRAWAKDKFNLTAGVAGYAGKYHHAYYSDPLDMNMWPATKELNGTSEPSSLFFMKQVPTESL